MDCCYTDRLVQAFCQLRQCNVWLFCYNGLYPFHVFRCKNWGTSRRSFMEDPAFILIDYNPSVERGLADVKNRKSTFYGKFPFKNGMDSCGTDLRSFSFHAMNYISKPEKLKGSSQVFIKML